MLFHASLQGAQSPEVHVQRPQLMQIRDTLPAVMTDASLKFRRTKSKSEVIANVLGPLEDVLQLSPDRSQGTNRLRRVRCGRRDSQTLTHCFASAFHSRCPNRHELLFKRNGALTPEPPALRLKIPQHFLAFASRISQEAPPPTLTQMQTSASAS